MPFGRQAIALEVERMSRPDTAVALFKDGFSCSQAVFAAFADRFGVDRDTALKVAAGFGGGIGRLGLTCGALTGGIMAIGMKHGAVSAQDREAKENTGRQVREFLARFKARHECLNCKDLLGCDLSTPEGMEQFKARNLHATACPAFVRSAAELLEEMLPAQTGAA